MRVHSQVIVLSLLTTSVLVVAGAQTRTSTTAAPREIAAQMSSPANAGASFQLICRGGPALRVGISNVRLASNGPTSWFQVATMTVDFMRASSPDPAGRGLQPGQCGPANIQLRDVDPAQLRSTIRTGNAGSAWQASAEQYPNADNVPKYLKDANHYWSFTAADSGEGYFLSKDSRYWQPGFYRGPAASASYQPAASAAVMAGAASTTVQATTPRYGGIGVRTEGRAGTPAVPSPAIPAAPPPAVPVPFPVQPVVFSPPLLEDNAQLWACADAAAAEAHAGACSGEDSARAYCRLREADSGPDLLTTEAQPGIPARAVNGDLCASDTCVVVSQLQCDH